MSDPQKRDLALAPYEYVMMQDTSKGSIKLYTGPTNITPTAQDRAIVYDAVKNRFVPCDSLDAAVQPYARAAEGDYIELLNPAKDNAHPSDSAQRNGEDLILGRKINIPGPASFALWPGQVASVIPGHHLRSNQYLLCRVYNETEAKKNWSSATLKMNSKLTAPPETASTEEKKTYEKALDDEKKAFAASTRPPPDLTEGKMFIIQGTEVSFYIPPTGITVVSENEESGVPTYAREALTLERLEYAVLVDENGNKRYEKGPTVVFPRPTERFVEQKNDGRLSKRFSALEMNQIQGIHVKVTADYEENGKKFKAGEELFITGKDTPIYYPREEHAAIKYDGKTKHFATAIPAGEARYVMNRMTGEIRTVMGETMLLPDPRTEIIVRRVLSDKQVALWYPGNVEALEYNRNLRTLLGNAPTTRTGVLSEGDIERGGSNLKSSRMRGVPENKNVQANYVSASNSMMAMDSSQVSKEQGYIGDEVIRASTYSAPRSITLEGKYQGVPSTELWTNYGVMVVSKTGSRRVEVGPKTLLLNYDESLEVLELSSGKPKTTDNLIKTVYLRVENNKVSDIVLVETVDHVSIQVSLSYRVNFEGDSDKWFAVENYIKFLCDHVRSVLKGAVRKIKVEDFYSNSTDILQDTLLGAKDAEGNREGMFFKENNMRIADVEVLGVTIQNPQIRQLLEGVQHDVVKSNIEVTSLRRGLEVTKEKETIDKETASLRFSTLTFKNDLEKESLASILALTLNKIANRLTELEEQKQFETEEQLVIAQRHSATLSIQKMAAEQALTLQKEEQEQTIVLLKAEAEAVVSRFKAVDGNFSTALLALSNNETLQKVAEAWNIQRAIGGDSVSDALSKVFAGTPLGGVIKQLTTGSVPSSNGASKSGIPAQS